MYYHGFNNLLLLFRIGFEQVSFPVEPAEIYDTKICMEYSTSHRCISQTATGADEVELYARERNLRMPEVED